MLWSAGCIYAGRRNSRSSVSAQLWLCLSRNQRLPRAGDYTPAPGGSCWRGGAIRGHSKHGNAFGISPEEDARHQSRPSVPTTTSCDKTPCDETAPIGEKAMTGAERMTQAARRSPSAYANGLGHYFPHYSTTFPLLLNSPPDRCQSQFHNNHLGAAICCVCSPIFAE